MNQLKNKEIIVQLDEKILENVNYRIRELIYNWRMHIGSESDIPVQKLVADKSFDVKQLMDAK